MTIIVCASTGSIIFCRPSASNPNATATMPQETKRAIDGTHRELGEASIAALQAHRRNARGNREDQKRKRPGQDEPARGAPLVAGQKDRAHGADAGRLVGRGDAAKDRAQNGKDSG